MSSHVGNNTYVRIGVKPIFLIGRVRSFAIGNPPGCWHEDCHRTESRHAGEERHHRHRRGHHRRLDRLASDQGRRRGHHRRGGSARRRRHADLICLDQCELGQSGAIFSAAHALVGRVDAACRRLPRHSARLDRRPVLGSAARRARSLRHRIRKLGLWHPPRRQRRGSTHRAQPRRAARLRPACRGRRRGRAGGRGARADR